MNEEQGVVQTTVDEIRRRLTAIRDEYNKEKGELLREQDAYGFTETINGGYTFRLGNEIKDFDRAFGIPAHQE
jgi:hypothetical protein